MEIRDRIMLGVKDLFWRFGLKSVTMDDIARQLGVSKKTIYQYFENKDVLVSEITKKHLLEQEQELQKITESSADAIDEILKLTEYIRATLTNINPSLFYELEKYYPAAWKIFLEHKATCVHQSIVENLKKGIEQGLFRKELNVEVLAILRQEEVQLGFNHFLYSPAKFNISEVHIQLLDHFLHGICTLKGHKMINKYKHITEEE